MSLKDVVLVSRSEFGPMWISTKYRDLDRDENLDPPM